MAYVTSGLVGDGAVSCDCLCIQLRVAVILADSPTLVAVSQRCASQYCLLAAAAAAVVGAVYYNYQPRLGEYHSSTATAAPPAFLVSSQSYS